MTTPTPSPPDDLTPRRRRILRAVVEEHIATGQPVGSRTLATRGGFGESPSTLRYELAWLERAGYLDHPHTSAGRVPTDLGYRLHAEELLQERPPRPAVPVEDGPPERGLDAALRATTERLAEVTRLLAAVSAPPLATTTIRHVEVLTLQPHVVMVVVITAAGGVAQRVFRFGAPVDPGLADWARTYLNETVTGAAIGTRAMRRALEAPDLAPAERAFLREIAGIFSEVVDEGEERLYVGGVSRLVSELRSRDVVELAELADRLEQRRALLELARRTVAGERLALRIGAEHDDPALRPLSVVAAPYGAGWRSLGTVSVIGPTRMDYGLVIDAVRAAASALSLVAEEVYDA